MAGIGFELRKMLDRGSLLSSIQAWVTAGLISSGPWIISILGVLAIGLIAGTSGSDAPFIGEFQVSVTWLMCLSLIFTGPVQLMFTRFVADRMYEKKLTLIVPNLFGLMLVMTLAAGIAGGLAVGMVMGDEYLYPLLMWAGFVIICNLWIVVVLLSAVKRWQPVLIGFAVIYGCIIGGAVALRDHGVIGPLVSFVAGHAVLLFLLLGIVVRSWPVRELIRFDFFSSRMIFLSLIFTGLFYNLAIWVDKIVFWLSPVTGEAVNGLLRYSLIYDQPIFLAYLSIVPGMAVFLLRVETDFAESYQRFYHAVETDGSMKDILQAKNDMIASIYAGIREIIKVQGITVLVLILLGGQFLDLFGISRLHQTLLNIDLVAVSVQLVLMAVLNMLFYFDRRLTVLLLSLLFLVANLAFTILSQFMGPAWYGMGFAAAVILSSLAGMVLLGRTLASLEYDTFMRRGLKI